MEKYLRGFAALALVPVISTACVSIGWLVNITAFSLFGIIGSIIPFYLIVRWFGWKFFSLVFLYFITTFFLSDTMLFAQLGDYFHYHYPQVLLLEQGWNPVFMPSMDAVSETLGVALDTFRPVHTICFPLLLAQWSAIVDTLTTSLCGYIWAVFLIAPAVLWIIWMTLKHVVGFKETLWVYGALAFSFMACGYRSYFNWTPVDTLMFLTSTFFLLSYLFIFKSNFGWYRVWFALSAILLCGIKQSGISFVALPLMVLFCLHLFKRDWKELRNDGLLILSIILGVMLLCFHPYLTNWSTYGSPLFPAHSFLETWKGWDITIDLGQGGILDRPHIGRFLSTQYPWLMLTFLIAIVSRKHANTRKWLLLCVFLLLNAFLFPSKLYSYSRYLTAVPLVTVFTLIILFQIYPAIKRRKFMWYSLCCVLISWQFLTATYSIMKVFSFWILASDIQNIFYTPTQNGDLVVVSTRANYPQHEKSVYLNNERVYPLCPNTYFLESVLRDRFAQPLTYQYMWTKEDILKQEVTSFTDLWLFVNKNASTFQTFTSRPLRLDGVLRFPEKFYNNFKYRWFAFKSRLDVQN